MRTITLTIEKCSFKGRKVPFLSQEFSGTIIARIRTEEGKRIKHRTPFVVPLVAWDKGQLVIPKRTAANYKDMTDIKNSIEEYTDKLQAVADSMPIVTGDTLRRAMITAKDMSLDDIQRAGQTFHTTVDIANDRRPLWELLQAYGSECKGSQATIAGIGTLTAAMRRYEESNGPLHLAHITAGDIQSFTRFLADEESGRGRKRKGTKRSRNTVAALVSRLRTIVRHYAKSYGLSIPSNIFDDTPTQEYAQEPIYLTSRELLTLAAYKCTTEAERDVLRAFVFQCCTGMRFGDLAKLQAIHRDQDGMTFVHYVANKTGERTKVPLSDLAMAQLDEGVGEKILSVPSLPTYNAKIKAIMRAAGITRCVPIVTEDGITYEPICDHGSSHMARRTFVGRLINANVPAEVVRSMSGHTEGSKAFARYYAITDDQKKEALKKISI